MNNEFDFVEFRLDTDKRLLYAKWLRDVDTTEYQSALKYIYQLIRDNNIALWLQNSESLLPRSLEEQKWAAEEFGFMIAQSPIKYVAIVLPKHSLHYAELLSLRDKAYRIFGKAKHIQLFETEQEALAWLIPNMQFYRLPAKKLSFKSNHPL